MNYVYVENNVVKEGPMTLPRSWRNISGLNYMTDAELLAVGWKPYRIDEGQVNEVYTGSTVQVLATEVVETKQWRAKNQEEKDRDLEDKKVMVRRERTQRLVDCDWVVIKSLESGQPVSADWLAYRQALRDVTNQAGFPFSVVWPLSPDASPAIVGAKA